MKPQLPCRKPELLQYTPHQSRMLLLDQIDGYSIENPGIETSLRISEESEFFDQKEQKMPVWVSFEYLAQSIAALSSIAKAQDNEAPQIGFIMGIRDCEIHFPWYNSGELVCLRVEQDFREGDIAVFRGEARVGGELYFSGILSVVENNPELIELWNKNH